MRFAFDIFITLTPTHSSTLRIAEEVLEGVNTSMVKVLENVMPEVELSQICEKTKAEALVSFQTRAYHSNANFQSIKAKLKKVSILEERQLTIS